MAVVMTEKMVELAKALEDAGEAYHKEYTKENPNDKSPVIWLKSSENGSLVVYTPGMYSDQLVSYINSGMNFVI